jgi:hypothetical protein
MGDKMASPIQSNPFTNHPHAVGESYSEHFDVAMRYSGRLFIASFCAFIHALLPFAFEKTASTMIRKMVDDMNRRHATVAPASFQAAE